MHPSTRPGAILRHPTLDGLTEDGPGPETHAYDDHVDPTPNPNVPCE